MFTVTFYKSRPIDISDRIDYTLNYLESEYYISYLTERLSMDTINLA